MEVSRRLVHCPLHSETQSHQREGRELEGEHEYAKHKIIDYIHNLNCHCYNYKRNIPPTLKFAMASDGLLLATEHV